MDMGDKPKGKIKTHFNLFIYAAPKMESTNQYFKWK